VPAGVVRPRQVHGCGVLRAGVGSAGAGQLGPADALLTTEAGCRIGVVTADCVPVLLASAGGTAVAAIHAGWRGLAAGVVEAGVRALAEVVPGERLHAAVGPCIGPCCYEVDAPVVEALAAHFSDRLEPALRSSRPGHWKLDLVGLALSALRDSGLATARLGLLRPRQPGRAPRGSAASAFCTCCDERFESHRRDGSRAGRMLHWISPRLDTTRVRS